MMDVGVIDVGSHTVRLLLARRDDGRIQPLRQEKVALGLGAEVSASVGCPRRRSPRPHPSSGRSPASPGRQARYTSRLW